MNRKESKVKFLFVIPAILYLLALLLFPGVYNLYMSFYKWRLGRNPKFVELYNYMKILTKDKRFYHALTFTVKFTVVTVILEVTLGLALAILAFYAFSWAVKLMRIVSMFPIVIAPIAAGYMWRMLLHGDYGVFTHILAFLGFRRISILADPQLAFWGVILANVWQWTPFSFLTFYAGIISMPREPYEAAIVDGASTFQVLRHITLPLLRPLIFIVVLLRVIEAFKVFDIIYITTGGGPGILTESFSIYIYRRALHGSFDIGYGGALAWIYLLLVITLASIYIYYLRKALRL